MNSTVLERALFRVLAPIRPERIGVMMTYSYSVGSGHVVNIVPFYIFPEGVAILIPNDIWKDNAYIPSQARNAVYERLAKPLRENLMGYFPISEYGIFGAFKRTVEFQWADIKAFGAAIVSFFTGDYKGAGLKFVAFAKNVMPGGAYSELPPDMPIVTIDNMPEEYKEAIGIGNSNSKLKIALICAAIIYFM